MATTGESKPYEEEERDRGAIIAVAVLLLAGYSFPALKQGLAALLIPLGVPVATTLALIEIVGRAGLTVPVAGYDAGFAEGVIGRGAIFRRSMYLVTAGKRMAAGGSVEAERRLFDAHRVAEKRRMDAAEQVDQTAEKWGPLLGWWNPLDERTTPLCRAAHGRNFRVDTPPQIGYPGTAHGGYCRCEARRPWPDGEMLP